MSPLYSAILAAPRQDDNVLTFLRTRGESFQEEPFSASELEADVDRAAHALTTCWGVQHGDPVLLLVAHPRTFLVAFLAIQEAGGIPVPLPSLPESASGHALRERVEGVVGDCHAKLAIAEDVDAVRGVLGNEGGLTLLTLAALLEPSPEQSTRAPTEIRHHEVALIQYTSGSTGTPKGVVVTFDQLFANCEAISALQLPTDRNLSWLPLHHDMGLIGGLLSTLLGGRILNILTPADFVLNPLGWLRAIEKTRTTVTVAPPMAYALCARRAGRFTGDLSSLRLAMVGSEPVDADLLDGFLRSFAPKGLAPTVFLPLYGLAEATLLVTGPVPGERFHVDTISARRLRVDAAAVPWSTANQDTNHAAAAHADGADGPMTFVSNGSAIAGHEVTIRAPETGALCNDREVGEVVIEGPCVSKRYYTEAISSPLRTGDLGYFADGNLYIVGRLKDIIIVSGRNYVPADIEASATKETPLREGRVVAFAVRRKAGHEGIGIAAEIVAPSAPADLQTFVRPVLVAIQRATGVTPSVLVFLPPRRLPRTTSGKIRRQAVRLSYEDGTLQQGAFGTFCFD